MHEPTRCRKKASIVDVASAAGVSPTTVSHALSGRRHVSEKTVSAIRRAMGELEYVPSHAGRSLRLGDTGLLGLQVPDISNPFYAELARGVEDVAESLGLNVLLCNTNSEPAREERYAEVFRSHVVDGLICAASPEPAAIERLAKELPVVIVNEVTGESGLDTVCTDNERGGALAAEHLRSLGHRQVLVIDGPLGSPAGELRRKGFEQAFAAGGVTVRHRRGDYRADAAVRIVRRELEANGPWFSAVYAANDVMAVAAIGELVAHGLEVPAEVSVVGYDDSQLAELVSPSLTTVRQPVYEMGRAGAERLAAAIRGDDPIRSQTVLEVELVPRESSARRTD